MSRIASPLSDRCDQDIENFLHGNTQHAWPGEADQGQIFDHQYFWLVHLLYPLMLLLSPS